MTVLVLFRRTDSAVLFLFLFPAFFWLSCCQSSSSTLTLLRISSPTASMRASRVSLSKSFMARTMAPADLSPSSFRSVSVDAPEAVST